MTENRNMKSWVLILLVLFSFSCQDIEKVERPKDLIAEKKMVEVLTDLSIMMSAKNFNRRMLEETGFKPGEYLYEKHDIDSIQLAASTKFYAQDPAVLERIYTKVQQNLESLKADLEIVREEEKRIQDSISALIREEDSLRLKDGLPARDSLEPNFGRVSDTLMPVPKMRRNRNQD